MNTTDRAAYLALAVSNTRKMFMKITIGDDVITIFFFITDKEARLVRVFVLGKPLEPSLIFADKAYPRGEKLQVAP